MGFLDFGPSTVLGHLSALFFILGSLIIAFIISLKGSKEIVNFFKNKTDRFKNFLRISLIIISFPLFIIPTLVFGMIVMTFDLGIIMSIFLIVLVFIWKYFERKKKRAK